MLNIKCKNQMQVVCLCFCCCCRWGSHSGQRSFWSTSLVHQSLRSCKIRTLLHRKLCFIVYMVIFMVVWFLWISRVRPCENFHFKLCIFIVMKTPQKPQNLSPHKFPHLVQNRENYGVYSISNQIQVVCLCCSCCRWGSHSGQRSFWSTSLLRQSLR